MISWVIKKICGWRGVFRLACLALVVLLPQCLQQDPSVLVVTGQIEGVGVEAGSRLGGRVSEVLAAEGDHVADGERLVLLESAEMNALVDGAEARLAQTEAALAKLEAGARPEQIRQAEAVALGAEEEYQMAMKGFRSQEVEAGRSEVEAARAARDEASVAFKRAEGLLEEELTAEEDYDKAKHALEGAEANYQAAREKLDILLEGTRSEVINMAKAAYDQAAAALDELRNGTRKEDIDVARAICKAASADLELAKINAGEMVVVSPCDGMIESLDIYPGDIVKAGPLVRIVDPDDLELVVYVSSAILGHLNIGQTLKLTTDSHGDESFEGRIVHIANQGEYTPRNLQTEEQRVQQVFGIKVKLDSAGGKLRAGMTATVHLDLNNGSS